MEQRIPPGHNAPVNLPQWRETLARRAWEEDNREEEYKAQAHVRTPVDVSAMTDRAMENGESTPTELKESLDGLALRYLCAGELRSNFDWTQRNYAPSTNPAP